MVIAQQMQNGMYGQVRQLPAVGMTVLLRLGRHVLHGDHHVPQGDQSCARVRVLRSRQLPWLEVKGWKTQHVCGAVHLPRFPVQGVYLLVVGDKHVHFTGKIHPLG